MSPTMSEKRSPAAAAQQRIQVRQLAALALVAHPDPVLRIPAARAMEEEEGVAPPNPRYFSFSSSIRCRASCSSGSSSGRVSSRRIAKIGQQAEVQVVVAIGQEPDFQRLDQVLDALRAREHGRDHDQRARFGRDSLWRSPCAAADAASPAASPASSPAPTASWLAPSKDEQSDQARAPSPARPPACACATKPRVMTAVSSRIAPRYSSNGNAAADFAQSLDDRRRTSAARSSCGKPLSIR